MAYLLLGIPCASPSFADRSPAATPDVAVGPQYDSTHVYVSPENIDAFVNSLTATFGGRWSTRTMTNVLPTPGSTASQAVLTPYGIFSVFAFQTPIAYPFGLERSGYLVTDMDRAIAAARTDGAEVVVEPFADPIGRDAVIRWPGAVRMQMYWYTKALSFGPLQTVRENRIYVSRDIVDQFVLDFTRFSRDKVISDNKASDGAEVGEPGKKSALSTSCRASARCECSSPMGICPIPLAVS